MTGFGRRTNFKNQIVLCRKAGQFTKAWTRIRPGPVLGQTFTYGNNRPKEIDAGISVPTKSHRGSPLLGEAQLDSRRHVMIAACQPLDAGADADGVCLMTLTARCAAPGSVTS